MRVSSCPAPAAGTCGYCAFGSCVIECTSNSQCPSGWTCGTYSDTNICWTPGVL